ncbi:DNA repair protein RadA [Corynebacterium suicordis]|uniref:DNA repair protein RadA n=1 Tax=Corynebacterium suicordis DSM 45110 TaxID=1121369 RepID=A0ABR9ZMG9_9CORY|nr:DNA repair protein RadA [Corynebacterium suicordis]MBF4554154.1 DNA repair protein RadA [Corynebacterium suicordis DSM 45110]MDR6276867.1 DNA repair protein RadA/Sms [Corynebacterium suicordis]
MATKTSKHSVFVCSSCEHQISKWMGRCPSCGEWGTLQEKSGLRESVGRSGGSGSKSRNSLGSRGLVAGSGGAQPITEISAELAKHIPSGISELDRVLGGGVVPGSAILLAGEPGVGKSTLLLEVAASWARMERSALIITAEESVGQVRQRAERTGALLDRLFLASENDLATAIDIVENIKPDLLIIDSLQTMTASDVEGVAGGVAHTKAVAATLTSLAKITGIPIVIVGHVTKEGTVAGPRTIEHLVDVVLNFEGDKHSSLRFLRGIKNRFGATDEVGCFEQNAHGIAEVADPSGLFIHHRTESVVGTAVTVAMDGRRALLGEIQTLAIPVEMNFPKRYVTGIEASRLSMVLAVLARRAGHNLTRKEVYGATVGGMKINEPAADLALALSLASTATDTPLPHGLVIVGEVGLGGEVRSVPQITQRLNEAERLGFHTAIVPAGSKSSNGAGSAAGANGAAEAGKGRKNGMQVIEVRNLSQALAQAFR